MRLHELQQKNSRARGHGYGCHVQSARLPEPTEQGCPPTLLCCDMATVLYRCPDTGLNVQGWLADDGAANEGVRSTRR
jgi:hypothetical protein